MTSPDLFLGVDDNAPLEHAKVVVLSVPYEATVSYLAGTARGPEAIVRASGYVEESDERTGRDITGLGIHTLAPLPVADLAAEAMVAAVAAAARPHFEAGRFVLTLGGEHTVTVGAAGAAFECYPSMGLLHIDAHHDLRLEYWGSKYSHACVVRRLHELYHPPVASVGIRAFCPDEKVFAEATPIPTCYAWDCVGSIERAYPLVDALPEQIYITLDVDGLDAAVMPATGTPEPNGLSYAEVVALIERACAGRQVVGADVVELSPRDGLHYADYTAAKLAVQLLTYGVT